MMRIFIIQVHDPVIHLEVDEELYPKLPVYSVFVFPPTTGGCSEGLVFFFFFFFFRKIPLHDNY